MTGSIALMLSKTGGPPFHGSVGYVNDAIGPILSRHGWRVRAFDAPRGDLGEEAMLPFALGNQLAALDGATAPDVALFDGAGTSIRTPTRAWSKRNVMLYHGLVYGTGAWMTSTDIDLHCANSPYLQRTLHAIFAIPNWRGRSCLNPHGMRALADIQLPVPCVESPDGHPGFGYGADIPPQILRGFDSDVVWGHALQPGKQDWFATLSVMYWLNQLRSGPGAKRIKLLVSESSLTPDHRAALDAMLAPGGRSCDDYFVRVPNLNQRALFRLMRSSRFALAYNRFPEPFGFYVLESVHNGCPVYTNGVGNNRFLLPPDHGITVLETPAMVPETDGRREAAAYRIVAERILADLDRSDDVGAQCRRGRALIDERWSLAAFERSLLAALDRLECPLPPEPDFEALEVQLSPLVRSIDPGSGRSLNDYASTTLRPDSAALLQQLLGRRCSELASDEMERIESTHGLFARGLLTLSSAAVPSSS
ncbi:hypothetical protein [Lysobacter tyrosinilyticus]